eukprot:UN02899
MFERRHRKLNNRSQSKTCTTISFNIRSTDAQSSLLKKYSETNKNISEPELKPLPEGQPPPPPGLPPKLRKKLQENIKNQKGSILNTPFIQAPAGGFHKKLYYYLMSKMTNWGSSQIKLLKNS